MINVQMALKNAGWIFSPGHGSMSHPSGAIVRFRLGMYNAERASGEKRAGIADRTKAAAWALGADVAEVQEAREPQAHRAKPGGHAKGLPDGWSHGARGVYKHAHGTVESGHCSSKYLGRLADGTRELFKLRVDALVWVENNGVWPAGYVRAEKRP